MPFRLTLAMWCVLTGAFAATKTQNVILVTADGLRWQELFTGIDPLLMTQKAAGMEKADVLRRRLWRPTAEERRQALMPFFWSELAPKGIVLGNVNKNSSVQVTNAYRVSYPGYSEILTGRAQDDKVRGNDPIPNPAETILEFLQTKLRLTTPPALFGSWETFHSIGASRPDTVKINAGYREADGSARMKELSALQWKIMTPWDTVRHDYVTFEMAMEHLKTARPRVAYIALGETDDWAHDRRYDRVLQAIEYFDSALRDLWTFIQSSPQYRDSTSLVITVDHGRGSTLEDWHGHGSKVKGAEQIWIAVAGPDTPARGELSNTPPAFQRDVAPTILDLLEIDYREYRGVLGKPIPAAKSTVN
jgi:hypothetical protein